MAHAGVPAKPHHIKNTLASETPTTDGERIYAYFGNVGVYCYDMDGQLLWTHLIPAAETTVSPPVLEKPEFSEVSIDDQT